MITLNIIPEKNKKDIALKRIYKSLKNLLFFIIILLLIYSILFLAAKYILQKHYINTIQETTLVTKSTENYSNKIAEINKQLNSIQEIQNQTVNYSYLLEYLMQNINKNINFSRIKIVKNDNKISFAGKSDTRESLLEFKEILENSDFFSDLNFPIKNLLEKNNINFEISVKLKSYEFDKLQ